MPVPHFPSFTAFSQEHRDGVEYRGVGVTLHSQGVHTVATETYSELKAIIHALEAKDGDLPSLQSALGNLARSLDRLGASVSAQQGFDELVDSVRAARASIEIAPALRAISALRRLPKRGTDGTAAAWCRSMVIVRLYAAASLVVGMRELDNSLAQTASTEESEVTIGNPVDEATRRNIAIYHREHERYYSWRSMLDAADICREANRLKTIGSLWADEAPAAAPEADFSDPRMQAAGCVDLNALRAIAGIGILFMEGENEPAEITGIRQKLRAMGANWQRTGQWLAEKMDAAWSREFFLLEEGPRVAAESRFGIIVTNMRVSRQMSLSGHLLEAAADILGAIDFRPAAVRANRTTSGARLLQAAWMLDAVAQLVAREAADLSENEMRWTRYLEVISTKQPRISLRPASAPE
jgi:hypothetical protein